MIGPIMGGVARLSFATAKTAMTLDGNSISDPQFSNFATALAALAPINGQFVITNRALSGQNIQQMTATASDVDNAYVNGRTNILFVWELTNNIHNIGRTGPQTIADLIVYINARQAYVAANRPGQKPWVIVLATGLPRGDYLHEFFTAAQGEVQMQYCNTYIRENYRAMGAVAYVEMRQAGGPFDFTDVTTGANFHSSLWTDRTHPNSAGKSILAGYAADVLKRLPAR